MKAKKSLGQHFLASKSAIDAIVSSADIKKGEQVLEIGPGRGVLTANLLESGARVIAVEKDEQLADELQRTFAPEIASGMLVLTTGDIMEFDVPGAGLADYKLVANIPYYITGEILRRFIGGNEKPSRAVLLIQKEVADRIMARDRKESILSISVKVFGTPRIVKKVPAGAFSPPPTVDSAILVIDNIRQPFTSPAEELSFFETVKTGFAHKRKKLAGNLASLYANAPAALLKCGIPPNARAEDLSLEQWKRLALELAIKK